MQSETWQGVTKLNLEMPGSGTLDQDLAVNMSIDYFLAAIIFFMAAFFNLGSFLSAFEGRPTLDPYVPFPYGIMLTSFFSLHSHAMLLQ